MIIIILIDRLAVEIQFECLPWHITKIHYFLYKKRYNWSTQ